MLRNTEAFVVDANVRNTEAAGESANELLKNTSTEHERKMITETWKANLLQAAGRGAKTFSSETNAQDHDVV